MLQPSVPSSRLFVVFLSRIQFASDLGPECLRVDPFLRQQGAERLDEFDLLIRRKVSHRNGEDRLGRHVSLADERSVVTGSRTSWVSRTH